MEGLARQIQSSFSEADRLGQTALMRRFWRLRQAWHPKAFEAATPKSPCPGSAMILRLSPDARRPVLKSVSKREELRLFTRRDDVVRGCVVASEHSVRRSCACGCESRVSCFAFDCLAGKSASLLVINPRQENAGRDYTASGSASRDMWKPHADGTKGLGPGGKADCDTTSANCGRAD